MLELHSDPLYVVAIRIVENSRICRHRHCGKTYGEHLVDDYCPLPDFPKSLRYTKFSPVTCEAVVRTFGDETRECERETIPGSYCCREHIVE